MVTGFVSLSALVSDFIEDNDVEQSQVDEAVLKKWASDCTNWINQEDQLVAHRTTIIDIDMYKGLLPRDLTRIAVAAYRKYPSQTKQTRKEIITQWIQNTFDPNQQLEINLINKNCSTPDCSNNDAVVEIDVDRIWEMSHPEIYMSGFFRKSTFGLGDTSSLTEDQYFRIMRYSTNDFFGLSMHINDCLNIKNPDINEAYVINPPYIETSFQKGEVLISYFGKKTDEFGDIMVPDHPDAINAVINYMAYKWFWRQWSRNGGNAERMKFKEAEVAYKTHLGQARSALVNLDYNKLRPLLDKNFSKRIPNINSDYYGNKNVPDRYDTRRNKFLDF